MPELFRDAYYLAALDEPRGLVRLERSPAPFPSLDEMERSFVAIEPILARQAGRKLLLDLRRGPPGRNDDDFEQVVERWRRKLVGFTRTAVLVRSVAGKLQVQRLAREEGRPANVFQDEVEALRFLG
jgi:hypothetical protein